MTDEAYIAPDRMERYTWYDGDLKFLTAEEFEEIKKSKNFKDFHTIKEDSSEEEIQSVN